MNTSGPYPGTQAVVRAIALLKTFDDTQPEWGLSELARAVGLNKTTTFRLLAALEGEGMIARNRDTGAYRLGPEAIAVGGRALRSNDLRFASHAELQALAQQTGESATLEILVGNEVLILEEVPGNHLVSTWQSIGTRYLAHATSTGKVLLAYLPEAERAAILERALPRLTDKTITDPHDLYGQLAQVRAQGYALAIEELEPGYVAVGAPVRNHDGQVVAALSLGGPTTRLAADRLQEIAVIVKLAADRVSSRLGYRSEANSQAARS